MLGSPFTAKLFHSFYEWEDSVRLGKSYYKIVNEYIKSSDE